ncbi:hypothetical protein JAAARDRAFT_39196 [Jaapia argillacea MUCL 33604]|uniref:MYND-type domain-containing protein n=1 Tax=Jaapia argillacea MUCL 33604 TaxID=933084 RepID=A0A067PFH1_9AGAM|nr:hypothetical protein JAAARDRAFT_39196 [Jaapia argillacea MUCL 33604]
MSTDTTLATAMCSAPQCPKPASGKSQCPKCKALGIVEGSTFCSQECFKNHWPQHKVAHHYTTGNVVRPYDDPWSPLPGAKGMSFYPPGARATKIETKRLILRAVVPEDFPRIHAVKHEPAVTRTQLYTTSKDLAETISSFGKFYVRSSVPMIPLPGYFSAAVTPETAARKRFHFAIESTLVSGSEKRVVEPKPVPSDVKLVGEPLDASGYIGHVSFQFVAIRHRKIILGDMAPLRELKALEVREGVPFQWPSSQSLEEVGCLAFYEIHPSFWNQGIMTEAMEALTSFCLLELGVHGVYIDPLSTNEGSHHVAKKLGFKKMYDFKVHDMALWSRPDMRGKKQTMYEMTAKDWTGRSWDHEAIGGKTICRYCLNPRSEGILPCKYGCSWALYCSEECRLAHWKLSGHGHQEECKSLPAKA